MRRLRSILTVGLVWAASTFAFGQQAPPAGGRGAGGAAPPARVEATTVLVLGAGSPGISAERSGTSLGVIVRGWVYIFDAGAGVERRMFEARARVSNTIEHIGPIFITHLHSDHTLGLPAMLYYHRERNQPFTLFGPPGIKNMMNHILAAYAEDREMRINGLEHAAPIRWETNVTEVTSGVVFHDDNVTVKAFEVSHGTWEHALGYRIETPDRSIVISGDTRPTDAIVQACNGCDILFHEIVWEDPVGPPRTPYMKQFHTGPVELGEIANRAKPKTLVLYHQVGRQTPAEFVRAVMGTFHGVVLYAHDFDLF
jgi:ribonuclease BN (tRNA processing enzyme)